QSGGLATVTATSHQMATGFDVTISGANETDYNGTFTIEAVSADTFTYSVPSGTASPATGTIIAQSLRAIVFIEANIGGINGNLSANETLDFVVTNPNLNSETAVIYSGLTGGADEETIPDFKSRVLDFAREPIAPFNVPNIKNKIKESVPTATRVFVNEITPAAGQTTIYFVLDGQPSIIPSSGTLTTAKTALEDIRPAVVDVADVFVLAPTLVPTDFTFISISPSTQTMRDAISANLEYLFRNTEEGVNITEAEYENVLLNTIDTVTGATLDSYVLSAPVGDITILSGELGTLGNVTF
ncbi:MAG: baseplate J/gp47 family protein, partial [Gammaproteobacteria bacterium]|nr:baseplate J/gp47 family protein [Gammaproteobacteria bacterium]